MSLLKNTCKFRILQTTVKPYFKMASVEFRDGDSIGKDGDLNICNGELV